MIFAVGFGASLGAVARYALTSYGKKHWMQGTAWRLPASVYAFLGTGVLGGYTTFSTLNTEMVSLAENGQKHVLKRYLLASYLGGAVLLTCGYYLGSLL